MDEKQLQVLVNEQAKSLKTPQDLNQFYRLLKISVGNILNTEMSCPPGGDINQPWVSIKSRTRAGEISALYSSLNTVEISWLVIILACRDWLWLSILAIRG